MYSKPRHEEVYRHEEVSLFKEKAGQESEGSPLFSSFLKLLECIEDDELPILSLVSSQGGAKRGEERFLKWKMRMEMKNEQSSLQSSRLHSSCLSTSCVCSLSYLFVEGVKLWVETASARRRRSCKFPLNSSQFVVSSWRVHMANGSDWVSQERLFRSPT